jgi:hypothetical protein
MKFWPSFLRRGRRTIILGLPKSGTTALFYGVRNALPQPPRELFEPLDAAAITAHQHQRHFLTKVLPTSWEQPFSPALLHDFTHRLFIVRDPRDVLVSRVLYVIWNTQIHQNPAAVHAWLDLLAQKQRQPHSIPLTELIRVNATWRGQTLEQELERIAPATAMLHQLQQASPAHCVLRYEDMVADRLTELETYLQLPLPRPFKVDAKVNRVARTQGSGNWKHWCTPADEPLLRPLLATYLQAYGYPPDWHLATEPIISPEHSTHYVLKIVNQKRAQEKLSPLAPLANESHLPR